jgi:hypothetical protein
VWSGLRFGKEPPVPIGEEAAWAPEPVWTKRRSENYCPHRDSNSDPLVVQPVANRCTDCAIPAPIIWVVLMKIYKNITVEPLFKLKTIKRQGYKIQVSFIQLKLILDIFWVISVYPAALDTVIFRSGVARIYCNKMDRRFPPSSLLRVVWLIDPLLKGDSLNNSGCYEAPAAYACAVTSHNNRSGDAGDVFPRSAPRLCDSTGCVLLSE